MSPSLPEDHHHHKKKRVGKACDSCRIKKTKCDGKKPCSRCIADNKLCAFTEKKKQKEKTHPSGYIDLLETRMDLLTKSLEKIVLMAEPHLPFLLDLMARARADHHTQMSQISLPELDTSETRDSHYVPINEVVAYLISDLGLLDKEPVEWESGALIAAKLDRTNVNQAALDFAAHKAETGRDTYELDQDHPHQSHNSHQSQKHYDHHLEIPVKEESYDLVSDNKIELKYEAPDDLKFLAHSRASLASFDSPVFADSYDQFSLSIGGFSALQLQHPQAQLLSNLGLEAFPKRANSLFINNNEVSSSPLLVLSLANRFENHDLEDPHRRKSLALKGPLLPSHQKMKMNGHVHKKGFQSHSHGTSNIVLNNGNEFHFPKQYSSTLSLPDIISSGSSKNLEIPLTIFDDDLLFDDLPLKYDYDFARGDVLEEDVFNGSRFAAGTL